MSATIESVRRQLADIEENLQQIAERKSQYSSATAIPLSLLQEERSLVEQRDRLRSELALLSPQPLRITSLNPLVVHWPPLWHQERPAESDSVVSRLKRLGFHHNPFGPLQAELDHFLPHFWFVSQRTEEAITDARPAVLYGADGAGKTATALWLAYSCGRPAADPRESSAFPVYMNLSAEDLLGLHSTSLLLQRIGRGISAELLRFFALNPETFLDHALDNKAALALLWQASLYPPNHISHHLTISGLKDEATREKIKIELEKFADANSWGRELQAVEWLDILHKSRPRELLTTYMIIDIHGRDLIEPLDDQVSQTLQRLLRQMIPLAGIGVYLKLFVPAWLYPSLSKIKQPGFSEVFLEWSPADLLTMLTDRLRWASAGQCTDLRRLFDPQSRRANPSLVEDFMSKAEGSPRTLIHLGNLLCK